MSDAVAIAELRTIPSIGPSLARDLLSLGVRRVADLKGRDPQALYDRLGDRQGQHHDRCVLYTFRCAVYYASTAKPDPEKLKWWNWMGPQEPPREGPARTRGIAGKATAAGRPAEVVRRRAAVGDAPGVAEKARKAAAKRGLRPAGA